MEPACGSGFEFLIAAFPVTFQSINPLSKPGFFKRLSAWTVDGIVPQAIKSAIRGGNFILIVVGDYFLPNVETSDDGGAIAEQSFAASICVCPAWA